MAECEKCGEAKPEGDGILILKEGKVACQLMWNSRNQRLFSSSMTHKDLASLNDIHETLQNKQSPQQTSYILRFLWRDLKNSYDIVGPSAESVDGNFISVCVLWIVKLLQHHNWKTNVLNLKKNHGCSTLFTQQTLFIG